MRRIAITLDAFKASPEALEQAVRLAQRMNAQLEGIFVEDMDLIQLAELPFLREVRSVSRSEQAIDLARMEQELRALARRAERLLSEQAARHNVSWSFRIWRGSIDSDLLTADIEADVFALTRLGAELMRIPALRARTAGVSVVFSGSEAAKRALDTAINLAADPQKDLHILLPGADEGELERLQLLAAEQLGDNASAVNFVRMTDGSLTDLVDILTETNSSVLVLERGSTLLQTPTLKQSLNRVNCPILVVR
jgi:nucleotide-binding universal stress UspA family protein